MTNSISDIAGANFILALGTNTTETHPIIGLQVKKALRQGAKLAVVDPRKTELAQLAHYHLPLKPGSDVALLNGLAHLIIEEELWNKEFVAQGTENFESFKQAVKEYTPRRVEKLTGIPAETVKLVARDYATAKNATILYTMGITQHSYGTNNVLAVANLALLCGQVGKKFSGVNPLRGQNNVQGACDMGALPDLLPGYRPITSKEIRNEFATAWKVHGLPGTPGLTIGEMMEGAGSGKIKAMYIMGENPVLSDADAKQVEAALSQLDFLVVQDIFLTETAKMADVILPAASFAEKDGTFTNTERRVQRVRKAIEPVGSSKADWEIICLLAKAMGYTMDYQTPEEIMEEATALIPSYRGVSYSRLESGGLQWPCPNKEHPGTPTLHQGKFIRGLGKFHPVEYLPPTETIDSEYPLLLNTGRRLYHYHTGTMSGRVSMLKEHCPQELLEINPADAEQLKLKDGDRARVISRRGSVTVTVKITDTTPAGTVFSSFHFPAVPINQLTNPKRDPVSKIPSLKVCAVRIERA